MRSINWDAVKDSTNFAAVICSNPLKGWVEYRREDERHL